MNLVGEMHMGQRRVESGIPRGPVGLLVHDAFKGFKDRSTLKAGWDMPLQFNIALPLEIVREVRRNT